MVYYTNQYPDRYVSDFERSLQFYDTVLGRLGCIRCQTDEINDVKIARYGTNKSIDLTIYNDPKYQKSNPIQPIKDFFFVESQNIVDTFYITAMEAGAYTVWIPESETDKSYSTCVQDPDGYTIAVKYYPSYKMLFVARNNINISEAIERLKHQMHSIQMQFLVISSNEIAQENQHEIASLEEKKIACFIYYLPSKWVIQFADTPARMRYWMHLRGFYRAVSICWQAKLLGDKNDLLLQLLDERLIDELHYESARLRADTFQALWYLIQAGEEFIREATLKLGCEYPFVSAHELFCYIIRTHIDNGFNVCRRPYYTVSKKDISDATKIRQELAEIINTTLESKNIIKKPKIHLRRIKGLAARFPKNSWLDFSVGVCALKAELRDELVAYFKAVKQEDEKATIALSRKRSSKTFEKPHSFIWQNGKMISASKHGGVYRS
jgi:hypothetical protein